ncbi:MAG: hypothetical protein PHI59_08415, partial [Candidatus Omnitrophica bacterium]|nr:hypothetical protein [Candidatus Omnitrophota bacterium]
PSNSVQNILKCISSAGYDDVKVVYTGIADGNVVLDREEKESGVFLLDIGAALTEMSIFFDGALCDMEILMSGAEDFKGNFRSSRAFEDIVSKLLAKIENFRATGNNLRSVVVTGGIIFTDGVIEYLEERISCPVKMGVSRELRGEVSGLDSVRLCTAIGLAKYDVKRVENKLQTPDNLAERVSSAVIDIFNNYF